MAAPRKQKATGQPVAADTILLGQHGEIHAGQVIPVSYVGTLGDVQETDFGRLEELGLVRDAPAASVATPEPAEPAEGSGSDGETT